MLCRETMSKLSVSPASVGKLSDVEADWGALESNVSAVDVEIDVPLCQEAPARGRSLTTITKAKTNHTVVQI